MSLKQARYEELLAEYSNHLGAIALLKQHRPYLEMIPSMRRPSESVIPIPLPIIRVRNPISSVGSGGGAVASGEVLRLPCDISILMCDPEWKIKTGVEIFVFIYRAQEDFSDLLGRWRQTQIWLDKGYEWLMPPRYQHILSEGADHTHPLFVVFPDTPDRIKRGLRGACLPFVIQDIHMPEEVSTSVESLPPEALGAED
ncbi:hypothetical protein H6G89_28730 [Oscillatoria sp. FACHB-1407]|uniref:hypothetical protein n=1 Tax=Oscillatoria sp. FACHB-1407 TaxID=2692847 RepID=UPI0016841F6F|nr:hypothetical protein [Oscillatoria sp. FACHB-1407]MBD2464995.1 hypothetical protein [Oscillatoria sp. FACHB-1407]